MLSNSHRIVGDPGAADDLMADLDDLPTLAAGVPTQLAKLQVVAPFGRADARVDSGPDCPLCVCPISAPLTDTLEQAIENRGVSIALS